MENLLLATELVKDYQKTEISPRCAMKIDISKAFDSVNWSFLLRVLEAVQIPDKFTYWIKLCITTASFSIQVNGELAGFFSSKRGLRQGCSLSPYLFIIYDIMVFSDGNARSMEGILQVFKEFTAISGLQISIEKSTLYMAGIPSTSREAILATFPFAAGSLPVRYLGLPLLTKRMTLSDCLPLIDKIRSRFISWKHRCLSYAGRLQLLRSVIASLTNFWISAFRLPSQCVKEIEKLCSAFLWSWPELKPSKAKIGWSEVCKPKKEGGLGLKSLAEVNKVCCFKLIWSIVSRKNSLWVDWIYRELIRNGSFWNVKSTTTLGSWIWKKLLKYRTLAKEFHRIEVKSGRQTSFWFDHWSSIGGIHEVLGDRGFINLGINSGSTVAEATRKRRQRFYRNEVLQTIQLELNNLNELNSVEDDVALWKRPDGSFRTGFKSSEMWDQTRRVGAINDWHKGIWFSEATSKFSFLAWLAVHNRLSTGDRMQSWSGNPKISCAFCSHQIESRDHLLFDCRFVAQIWENLTRNLLQCRYTTNFNIILQMISTSSFNKTTLFLVRYVFQALIHKIWWERNRRRHGELPSTSTSLIKFIDRMIRNRISSLLASGGSRIQDARIIWFGSRV